MKKGMTQEQINKLLAEFNKEMQYLDKPWSKNTRNNYRVCRPSCNKETKRNVRKKSN